MHCQPRPGFEAAWCGGACKRSQETIGPDHAIGPAFATPPVGHAVAWPSSLPLPKAGEERKQGLCTPLVGAMAKRAAANPSASSSSGQDEFRDCMAELFLRNDLPACKAQRVMQQATRAGAAGVEDLARTAASGRQPGNANRDLLKALLKNKPWPPVYWADIPIHDPGTGEDRQASLPFMLPHEILAVMVEGRLGDCTELVPEAGIHPELRHHVSELAKEMGVDPCTLIPCGLHGDGVPFGASGDSLEQVSINFLCLPEDGPAPRVPVAMVQKRFVKKHSTFAAIMHVLAWSFRMLGMGGFPSRRHDMEPWSSSDGYRQQRSGKPLPAGGCLCEVRGDWAFFKQTFDFPAWNTKSGVCWQCCCQPEDIRDTSLQASWRAQRLSPEQFVARQRMAGARVSPLFSCPGFTTACVRPDWLHTADQGVAADALGNIFLEVVDDMAGPNREAKVKELWRMIRQWYDGPTARADSTTWWWRCCSNEGSRPNCDAKRLSADTWSLLLWKSARACSRRGPNTNKAFGTWLSTSMRATSASPCSSRRPWPGTLGVSPPSS